MGKDLRARYLEALEAASSSLRDVARSLGVAYRTLMAHRSGERGVTVDAALRLVAYLRTRGRELERAADRLEAAAKRKKE
jgi:plasmid maintenance system antidote protein VapI